jgi:hypothetical protein
MSLSLCLFGVAMKNVHAGQTVQWQNAVNQSKKKEKKVHNRKF